MRVSKSNRVRDCLLMAGFVAGCATTVATAPSPPPAPPPPAPPPAPQVKLPELKAQPERAELIPQDHRICPVNRFIAEVRDGVCRDAGPAPTGRWAARWLFDPRTDPHRAKPGQGDGSTIYPDLRTVFDPGSPFRAGMQLPRFPAPPADMPPALRRFCVYEWLPNGAGDVPVEAPRVQNATRIAADCQAVAVTAAGHAQGSATLERAFLRSVEHTPDLPSAAVRTRVAVVDDEPDGPFPATVAGALDHRHGRLVGMVINKLACPQPGSSCLVSISNHLALSLKAINRPGVDRGYFGSHADLAAAIHRAVDAWRLALSTGQRENLVVNLSLGWEPRLPHTKEEAKRAAAPLLPGEEAVKDAIRRARCEGALVVAAAGNGIVNHPGSGIAGPLLPAAWEEETLTRLDCKRGLRSPVPFAQKERFRRGPLVYAAGGVDRRDLPLVLTRKGGRPSLAAAAAHVSVANGGNQFTPARSGTSFAAAAVSAVAGAAWAYRAAEDGDAMVELVKKTSRRLTAPERQPWSKETPSFCNGGGCQLRKIMAVSLCRAVKAAAGQSKPVCESHPAYGRVPKTGDSVVAKSVSDGTALLSPCAEPSCARVYDGAHRSSEPWVDPQPPVPRCPSCRMMMLGSFAAEALPRSRACTTTLASMQAGLAATFEGKLVDLSDTNYIHLWVETEDGKQHTFDLPIPGTGALDFAVQVAVPKLITRASLIYQKTDGTMDSEAVLVADPE